ncbi:MULTISPECIES: MalY/PatB family protein [Deefgea]|uniref:Putative 8-amino-7-oxononanoate synthase n=1 Tax=Deefgea chitinilytica TaxID=570276 RepID=A0ABS2C9A3_9NEIS|nr:MULTISPECIES: PatB family C-S lyase [Deefgea]MBM5570719.1 putative C-S lyase [Deefgea chitinilytica]MBM9887948.1 putative C-S lyase [Deefgea sp. CFH1-16]
MSFTKIIDRRATDSMKWDKYKNQDILPMWVADMDFPAPPSVIAALQARIAHGVLGYTNPPTSLFDAVQSYAAAHYDWQIDADWIVWLPGLVQGLNLACRAVGESGDAVVTATPIYPPFLRAPGLSDRELIAVPLMEREDGVWIWDFAALEAAITPRTRLLLLCHPHNPVGRVWNRAELDQLLSIVRQHNLIVCSDEIHCDLLLDVGLVHTPFATLDPDFAARTITLLAPSKTWNIPGLGCAFAVIPDPALRARFRREMAGLVPSVNALGYIGAEAAYRDDGQWHQGLIDVLRTNRQLLADAFAGSPLRITFPQATYLAWIDARSIDPMNPLPAFESLGVGLSDGRDFGFPGWLRINFGCPSDTVREAFKRLSPLLCA